MPRSICLLSLAFTALSFSLLVCAILPSTGTASEPVFREYRGGDDFVREPMGCVIESVRKFSEDAPFFYPVRGCCRRRTEEEETGTEWDALVADSLEDYGDGYEDGDEGGGDDSRSLYTSDNGCDQCLSYRSGCSDFYEYTFTSLSDGKKYTDVHDGGRRKTDDGDTVQKLCGENGGETVQLYRNEEMPKKVDCWRLRVS